MTQLSIGFQNILNHASERLPEALATLVIGLLLIEVVLWVSGKLLKFSRLKPGLKKIVRLLIRTFLWIVLFIAIIQALGLNNIFIALAGSSVIISLIVSIGIAPLISDLLAGVFLAGDRQFQPGAVVRAGDRQTEGTILTLDLRKTYIEDRSGKVHVLPNSVVEKNEWVILKPPSSTGRRKRRILKKST